MSAVIIKQRSQQAARPSKVNSRRVVWVLLFFLVFGLYNTYKVFDVQVMQYADLATKAKAAIKWKDILSPRRGLIYDSRMQLLAGNISAQDVYVDIKNHSDQKDLLKIADLLAPLMKQNPQDLYTRLTQPPTGQTYIKVASKVDDPTADKIRQLVDDNSKLLSFTIGLPKVPLRQYPGDTLASSLLGFTDSENNGNYGVEEYYNSKLAGEAGWIIAEHDAQLRPLVLDGQPDMQPAKDGSDLVLTIDSAVQFLIERGLKQAVDDYQAESGYVVVQDPNTGAILGMANYPSFNPNEYSQVTDYSRFKNAVVSNLVEPGSTMKILTYSSAIDAGAVMSTTSMYGTACVNKYGSRLCNATFTDWGWQTMLQGLGRSDNVASMFAAEKLGEQSYYKYLKAFRINKPTGIDVAGEASPMITFPGEEGYSPINLYTNSFGQGVAVTPVQLITAVSAVANGGTLLKPYVMKEIRQGDTVIQKNERQVVAAGVIKPETARQIADMLAYGVENKLVARLAKVPGYHVSVKTGTANIAANGSYAASSTLASAMGFAPSQGARFTLYLALVNPRTSPWGENTASPAWGKIAQQLLLYMKVQPTVPLPTPTPTHAP